MGHIPREISRHCYFFMEEGGNIIGHFIFVTYKVSPFPAGGLEVLLLLTFFIKNERIFKLMKDCCKIFKVSLTILQHWEVKG